MYITYTKSNLLLKENHLPWLLPKTEKYSTIYMNRGLTKMVLLSRVGEMTHLREQGKETCPVRLGRRAEEMDEKGDKAQQTPSQSVSVSKGNKKCGVNLRLYDRLCLNWHQKFSS